MAEAPPTEAPGSRGTALVVVTIVAASIEPIVARLGVRHDASPLGLLVVRNVVAAATILPFLRGLRWAGAAETFRLSLVGALLFATSLLSILALIRLPVAVTVTLVSMTPLWVALASARRSGLGARFFLALGLAITGIVLTVGPIDLTNDGLGVACALGTTVTSTLYRLLVERLGKRHAPSVISSHAYLVAALLSLGLVPFAGDTSSSMWLAGGWIGISAAVSNVAFVAAVTALGAARVSLALLLQRPLVIACAAVVLGEALTAMELVGVTLVIVGVGLAMRPAVVKTS